MKVRCSSVYFASLIAGVLVWASAEAAQMRISNLEDVDFGQVTGAANRIQQHLRICVSSSPAGPYQLVATGEGGGGAFTLSNGGAGVLEYAVSASARGRGGAQYGRIGRGDKLRNG